MDMVVATDGVSDSGGGYRFAAFLSYSHHDRAAAARLHSFLENYRIPRELVGRVTPRGIVPDRLRPIFRDREDLAAADDLSREIDVALGTSRALIVLCSPHAAVSRWANIEIARFKSLRGGADVFAAIIAGEPFASDHPARAADECFPPALRQHDTPDGPVRAEPVGADLRRQGDGLQAGRLKLVAGLIGVPLDELVHRDARRRHRRTLALVITLLFGLALTSALALFALRARNEAVRQRAEAEGLIEFMLGDLRKKLEPVGRLGAMDTLGERALAFYQRQDASALDPDSLGRRARVVQLIGEIQDQRGNLDTAIANFETAFASTAELLARDPDNPQRMFDHSQSAYWVGYIAYRRGNFAKAEPGFRTYLDLAARLVAAAPGNADWLAELGYAQSNLATLSFAQGRNAEAAALFEKSLALSRAVAQRAPDNMTAQLDLATSLAWVADAKERLGALDKAAAGRESEAVILTRVLANDPENRSAQRAMVVSQRARARLALAQGNLAEAKRIGSAATRLATDLVKADPSNTEWAAAAVNAHLQLGSVLLAASDNPGVSRELAAANNLSNTLGARDRNVPSWQKLRIRERLLRAEFHARNNDFAQALGVVRAAQAGIGALPIAGRDDSETRWMRTNAHYQAGQALVALGNRAAGRIEFAAAARDRAATGIAEEPRMAALRARAQAQLAASTG